MFKIALCLIVKGTDEEALLLERCLRNCDRYFDAVYVTSTYITKPNKEIDRVCAERGATVSYFKWINDFAAARNFNWVQVPKEYEFIAWCDADDKFWTKGTTSPHVFKDLIESAPDVDAWTMQYFYDKDENNNPTVIHTKTQIVRNDGCVEWIGRIHEDFKENRSLKVQYVDDIKRIHVTAPGHAEEAFKRNVLISKLDVEDRPNDPRAYFNLANSYLGAGKAKQAKETYLKFLSMSNSEEEKYISYQRLAQCEKVLGNKDEAIRYLQISLGMYPEFPDSFNQLGYMCMDYGLLELAEKYLLIGLVTKPQYQRMIVYNPRDYDYNPMMALAKLYFRKSRPDLALPMLKGCLTIYPDDERLKHMVTEMTSETERLQKVLESLKYIESLGDDKEKVLYEIGKLPIDLQSHPAVSKIRNEFDIKTYSSGRDIAYYCGETAFDWNPELFKTKGFGGSEEAVINLSKEWVKAGYNVTVYNSCGTDPMTCDGVTYKPWWTFNGKDKWDTLIMWRHPKLLDYELNCENILIDLHDVLPEGEFTEKRLKKIKKIMVKTQAHRVLFPHIPDEKFAIIPNGMDFGLFDQKVEKDPYLLINTSSPDRCMDVLPKLFKEVKKRVPQARLVWAYGWDNFDKWHGQDKRMMEWRHKIAAEMEEAGIEDRGRLSQSECAKLYLEGTIMAYPSTFYEIDCISVKKAQACGCVPITSDFAAFNESVKYGIKVPTKTTIKDWALPYQIGFGIKDHAEQGEWINRVVEELERPYQYQPEMKEWAKQFEWPKISNRWLEEIS